MAVHSRTSYAYRLHRAGAPEQARAIVDAAEQGIEAIDEQNIDAAALHSMVARYYVETGRPEAATRHLEAAERIASAFGMTDVLLRVGYYHTRGQWLEARGRLEAAVAAYAGHVALDPSDTTSRLRIADLTYRMGRTAEAARYYRAVLQRRPGTPLAQAGYARLLYDTGKRAEARTHLDRALQAWSASDPAFEPAAAARQLHAELTGRVGPAAASDSAGPTS
jgi:tetratricopeptide (TPR) repeat protein